MARYFYGVNVLIGLLEPEVLTLTKDNWMNYEEPA